MKFSFVASERHFADHLRPVWDALDKSERGEFIDTQRGRYRLQGVPRHVLGSAENLSPKAVVGWQEDRLPHRGPLDDVVAVAAAWGDFSRLWDRGYYTILFEHGFGQTYLAESPSYAGSLNEQRGLAAAFIVPNDHAADANLRAHPNVPNYVIGVPRLDVWHRRRFPRPRGKPVVAVSFHWDGQVVPETRTSWPWFKSGLRALKRDYHVLGHGHPRIFDELEPQYRAMNIESTPLFDEVMERADLYVCDNSSTLFEFASTGRPVVVLNAPWYRRDVEHGLRFWRCAEVGVNCDHPKDLPAAVARALERRPADVTARHRALRYALPFNDGYATERAVNAIREVAHQREQALAGF